MQVRGRYQLERRLGSGAMGEVWLGRHLDNQTLAAVKVLRDAARSRGAMRKFFAREGRAIARLSHPHIVALFDIGDDWFATAYIDGADLARRLQTPMDPAHARRYILQIASALAHAHAHGVIHRDVKPGNVLLDRRDNAYLADFGLAAITGEETGSPARVGTPGFMAPEQDRGEAVTPAADQYALARTLLEMLVGARVPIDPAEAVDQLPSTLPAALRDAVARATAQSADERWPSVAEFAAAIGAIDLRDHPAPVRLAPETRVRAPFAWTQGARASTTIGVHTERVDYRLGELCERELLPADPCRAWRESTGYRDFGWTLFGRRDRLGPLADPSAPARASELVVLLHGFAHTREVWTDVATAVCRDNAQTLVMAPDVMGFGESRFARRTPPIEQVRPPSLVHALVSLLELLGVRDLPAVFVGHSMGATQLMAATEEEVGPRTSRIAITPVFPFSDPVYAKRVRMGQRLFRIAKPLLPGPVARAFVDRNPASADLADDVREAMRRQLKATSGGVLSRISQGIAEMTPARGTDLRGLVIVTGANDAHAPPDRVAEGVEYLGLSPTGVHRMATGGHYPHTQHPHHPEWTARNTAQIVALIDTMLVSSREGTVVSTMLASTAHSADPPPSSSNPR